MNGRTNEGNIWTIPICSRTIMLHDFLALWLTSGLRLIVAVKNRSTMQVSTCSLFPVADRNVDSRSLMASSSWRVWLDIDLLRGRLSPKPTSSLRLDRALLPRSWVAFHMSALHDGM
jgi:hypothetical protein